MGRRPVLTINSLVMIAAAVVPLLASFGVLDLSTEAMGQLMAVVLALAGAGQTGLAQRLVTPVNDPRDDEGRQLAPREGPSPLEVLFGLAARGTVTFNQAQQLHQAFSSGARPDLFAEPPGEKTKEEAS